MGSKTKTVNKPETLTPEGRKQFDFAAGKLEDFLGRDLRQIGFDRSGLDRGISDLRNFGPSQSTNNRLDDLAGFTGTERAKSSLDSLGQFRGSGDAFRTLGALESFGAGEQQDVTDARKRVLNFDGDFESNVLPLLQQEAEGKFLTQQSGNPFIADLIASSQRGAVESFNESVLPNLLASFSGTGGVGSTLQAGFANQQARDLQRTLGDISTNIGFNVFESERERQRAAQNAILGFEDQGLNRQLQARSTDLNAAQATAQQLLDARVAAGGQATQLSQQQLDALAGRAQGDVGLSGQRQASLQAAAQGRVQLDQTRQAALQAALQGEQTKSQLDFTTQQLNAQLENDRIAQLLEAQRTAGTGNAGKDVQEKLERGI